MLGIGFEDLTIKFISDYDVKRRSHLDHHGVTPGVVYGMRQYTCFGNRLLPNDFLKIGYTQSMHKRFRNFEQDGTHSRCEFLIYTDIDYEWQYQKSMLIELERQVHLLFDDYKVNPKHTFATELFAINTHQSIDLYTENLPAIRNYPSVMKMDIFEDGQNYQTHEFRDTCKTHTITTYGEFFD